MWQFLLAGDPFEGLLCRRDVADSGRRLGDRRVRQGLEIRARGLPGRHQGVVEPPGPARRPGDRRVESVFESPARGFGRLHGSVERGAEDPELPGPGGHLGDRRVRVGLVLRHELLA